MAKPPHVVADELIGNNDVLAIEMENDDVLSLFLDGWLVVNEDIANALSRYLKTTPQYWFDVQREFDEMLLKIEPIRYAVERNLAIVMRFGEAPRELQKLSTLYGDEDWIAFVPAKLETDHYIAFDTVTWFAPSNVMVASSTYGTLYIGAHA